MSFSADWLALRAPADAAARDPALVARLVAWAGSRPTEVVDLGSGTGATHRALAPHLPGARWRLVDSDPALLAEAAATGAETLRADLSAELEAVLSGPEGGGDAEPARLVTASALLDLASADWIDRLAAALAPGTALYAALSYDGRERWSPQPPHEAAALAAFHGHMRGAKGLGAGPALGPEGAGALAARLAARGWRVRLAPSPWRLGAEEAALIAALAEGSAGAVAETGALGPDAFAAWAEGRRQAREVEVGHLDLLALPGGEG